MASKMKAFVVPHTHWDRAWYVPFEEFRIRLVRLIDRVLDILKRDADFACFALDGQTVVLEDYLAIRPGKRAELAQRIKERRITVGPWFVQPDELLTSPESLVRNLMLGQTIAGEFGHSMDVGYCPDGFGHVAQLPQILRGFGLDNMVFGRGIDVASFKAPPEFTWRGIDGSTLLALHMRWWYNNAAFLGYRIPWGDSEGMLLDRKLAIQQLRDACANAAEATQTRSLLLCNGVDHSEAQPELPKLLKAAARELTQYDFRIATHEDYVRTVKKELAGRRLPLYRGEMWYPYGDLLRGVDSSRMYLKVANQECQDLLEKQAEPLSALAWAVAKREYPAGLLWHAWRELLKCHPHDDICGCSADAVHADMEHRFGVVKQVGGVLTRDAVRALGMALDHTAQDGVPVMVYNPAGAAREEVVRLDIDLLPAREPWRRFSLFDEDGREVPYDFVESKDAAWMQVLKSFEARRHTIEVKLSLPPMGYRTLYVREGKSIAAPPACKADVKSFDSEHYRLRFAEDGSVQLTDKATGRRFRNLLTFEDAADAGDVYNWSPLPTKDKPVTTRKKRAKVRLIRRGAYSATWRVTHRMNVPAALTPDRQARATDTKTLEIVSEVTCRVGSPRVDIETRVFNTAKDHRLRVLFPTPFAPDTVDVDGHYAVLQRPVAKPARRNGVPPYPTQNQRRFAALRDDGAGIAVINLGLPEFEAVEKRGAGGHTLALTLYRSIGWLSRCDLVTRPGHTGPFIETPGAQCLRPMVFNYGFTVFNGALPEALREAERHNLPPVFTRCDILGGTDPKQIGFMKDKEFICGQPFARIPREGETPSRGSFVDIGSDALVLSAVKKCETRNSLILRVYNPGAGKVSAVLRLFAAPKSAYICDLRERRIAKLKPGKDGVPYACKSYQVLTIEAVL